MLVKSEEEPWRNFVRNLVRNLVTNLVRNLVKRTTSQDSHRILKGPLGVPTRFSRRISTDSHRILTGFSQDSHRIFGIAWPPGQSFYREPHSILTGCSASPQIFSQRTSQDSHRKTDLSALQSFKGYRLTTLCVTNSSAWAFNACAGRCHILNQTKEYATSSSIPSSSIKP